MGGVYLPSQLERIPTLYMMVDMVKGGGRAPPLSPACADFILMMECTPESGHCHSVYSVAVTYIGTVYCSLFV